MKEVNEDSLLKTRKRNCLKWGMRDLTKHGPREKRMAKHFSVLALRTA